MQNQNSQPNPNQEYKELLDKYAGITARLKTIFDYHYDQIMREIEIECSSISKEDKGCIMDNITLYMEEYMAWPSMESIEDFKNDITFENFNKSE